MKIAAYCRVSTSKEEQLDSLENQKAFLLPTPAATAMIWFGCTPMRAFPEHP